MCNGIIHESAPELIASVLEPSRPRRVLVLPAHVAVKHRRRPLGQLRQQPAEQGEPLGHVQAGRCGPRQDLLAAEVVHRREVRLAPGLNSVTSVPVFSHGVAAEKSRPVTFSNASPTTPLCELYLWQLVSRRMPQRIPISRIILSTVLSATRAPSSARRHMATCRWPQPFAVREKISAAAPRSSGLVGLAGCDSA